MKHHLRNAGIYFFLQTKLLFRCALAFYASFQQYLVLLLCIFLLEIIAGVLAYITYQEVKYFYFFR